MSLKEHIKACLFGLGFAVVGMIILAMAITIGKILVKATIWAWR